MSELTSKKYNIIYADPAWQFNNKNTGGSMKSGASAQYDVMTAGDMASLPVPEIAADNCVLVMWWVGSQPQEAIDLAKAWGFTIKNMNGFVWEKLTKNGLPHFGMGFWTRAGSESAMIAIRGKPKPASHSVRAVRRAIVGRHSEKPKEFRDDIVALCGDLPRIELFARDRADGWDAWGNELGDEVYGLECRAPRVDAATQLTYSQVTAPPKQCAVCGVETDLTEGSVTMCGPCQGL